MTRRVVILDTQANRLKAAAMCSKAPDGWRVEFRAPTRSTDQNALMWARLTEISQQVEWHGMRLSPNDWKEVLTAGLKREVRPVPNIDGDGFVMLGLRTSEMTVAEMRDFMALVEAFAARQGVAFTDTAGNPAVGAGRPIHPDTQRAARTSTGGAA